MSAAILQMETNKRRFVRSLLRARRVWLQLNLSEVIDGRENEAEEEEEDEEDQQQQQRQSRVNIVLAVNSIPFVVFTAKRGSRTPTRWIWHGSRELDAGFGFTRSPPLPLLETVNASSILKSPDLFIPSRREVKELVEMANHIRD